MRPRDNQLTRKQQRRILEITAIVSLLLLIISLSHINLVSENNDLQTQYDLIMEENTQLKQENEIKTSEVAGLEWQLEQEKAKKQ
jgi:cell division protein FtsB